MKPCSESKTQQWILNGENVHCVAVGKHMCLDMGSTPTCADAPFNTFPYCNPNMTYGDRAKDMVSRMTVEQKISQLGNTVPAVQSDNISIAAYQWWNVGLHGMAYAPGIHFGGKLPFATSYPQVNTLGATFNRSLWLTMGRYIATEARAFANQGQAGLTYWDPNINIYRDPRWGRGQETPGEDPYLTASYAEAFVSGMQVGEDPRYFKVIPTCKHYDAYDLENWNGTDRHHFNAVVSAQDLVETYLPAFESCVRTSHGGSIMCSYNAVNGVPSCANDFLQNEIVRGEWGFTGYIVSDCGAISNIIETHHYTDTPEATVAAGLKGGCDLDCGGYYQKYGQVAIDKKTITEDDLDTAIMRLFEHRIRLGEFDPPGQQPYRSIGTDVVCNSEHTQLALDAARQGIVLLKNENGELPLRKTARVAIIGPNANATKTMQGNYYGVAPFLISPMMGIQALGVRVTYSQGCDIHCSNTSGFASAINLAKQSDAVILVIGSDNSIASEGHDRTTLSLPGNQEQLIEEVKEAAKGPVIVVLMSGGPYDISYAKANVQGVLWVGYPGQSGGQALAEVLFGDYNPGGRLPFTFYPADYVNQISFFDMSMRTPPGRTYKFYTGEPIYWFGDGLSYTTFSYNWSDSDMPCAINIDDLMGNMMVRFNVTVTNTGQVTGNDVVLAYVNSTVSLWKWTKP
jgi:beta-glucosidase-like glycosyl hydrolase